MSLGLEGCPLADKPDFRQRVFELLPELHSLDGKDKNGAEAEDEGDSEEEASDSEEDAAEPEEIAKPNGEVLPDSSSGEYLLLAQS